MVIIAYFDHYNVHRAVKFPVLAQSVTGLIRPPTSCMHARSTFLQPLRCMHGRVYIPNDS
jgi:hypothetical protein